MKFKVNYSFGHRIFPENPNKSQKESNQIFCRYQKIVVGDFWTMMMVEWSATEVVEICCMAVNKYNADAGCDFIPNFYGIGIELNLICSHHKSELHSTRMQFNKQIEYRTMLWIRLTQRINFSMKLNAQKSQWSYGTKNGWTST